ncbi:transglycosylase family protein [Janibacter sp. GXQ6167]|uniref:transglycosylase family protein n=1 Tax=Janibacter sp. GXQ6167 TaxID=3240791 RepID=UPI0035233B4C
MEGPSRIMFYAAKHAERKPTSTVARRAAGVAVAGATVAAGSVAAASSAQAAPSNVWDRVAQCESGGRWSINTGNGYYGGLQFHSRTWTGHGGRQFASTANKATRAEQITVAKRVLRSQGPGAWPHCGRRAGLTKANGLAAPTGTVKKKAPKVARTTHGRKALPVTGKRGSTTNYRLEIWVGGSRNGSLQRNDVRKLQRKVGLPAHQRNGWINDRRTVKAIQKKVGVRQTGQWSPGTVKALQRHLNRVL